MSDLHSRAKGNKGEDIACIYLVNRGYEIEKRNYQKAWGELDIVAVKDNIVNFFEVKSVTDDFSGLTDVHRPEDNVNNLKVRHIRRIIQSYLHETNRGLDVEFRFHVICVYMDLCKRKARIHLIDNVII